MRPNLVTSVRYLQITLGLCFCFYFLIVAVNNCLDYQSNFAFVKHVMAMDSTFQSSKLKYRSINSKYVHNFVYLSIIVWEALIAIIMGFGSYRLIKNFHLKSPLFDRSKGMLILGFTLSIILWFYAFIIVGGEWFLMWQSPQWNGQTPAFHLLMTNLLAVVILLYSDEFVSSDS